MKAAQGGEKRKAASKSAGGARIRPPGSEVLSKEAWKSVARSLKLSARQCEILKAIFDDEGATSIARRLGISPKTVHSYMQRLHQKFGVGSRAGLVVRVTAELLRAQSAPGDRDDAASSS